MFWLLSLLLFLIICIITITIITTIILVIIVIFCIPIVLLLLLPLLFSLLYPQCIPWLSPMCEMWDSISTPEIDRFATSQNLDSDWSVAKPSRILVVLSLMRCVFFSKHILTLCYELWLNSSMIVVWWNSQRLVHHGLITLSISYLQLSTIILKYHIKFIILIRYRINIYIYISDMLLLFHWNFPKEQPSPGRESAPGLRVQTRVDRGYHAECGCRNAVDHRWSWWKRCKII